MAESIIRVCRVPGCWDRYCAQGLCRKHYARTRDRNSAQRKRLAQACVDCGADAVTRRTPARCRACWKSQKAVWTQEIIIERLQRWAAIHGNGEPPRVKDWTRTTVLGGLTYPTVGAAQKHFGSWKGAVKAAGLEPRPRSAPGRRGTPSGKQHMGKNRQTVTGDGLDDRLPGTIKHFGRGA